MFIISFIGPKEWPSLNDVLGKLKPVVCIFKIVIMFAEPYMERTAGLACTYFVAI